MRKKKYTLLLAGLLVLSMAAGCGSKAENNTNVEQTVQQSQTTTDTDAQQSKDTEENAAVVDTQEPQTEVPEEQTETSGEAKTLIGTVEEIKDFLFVVKDEEGTEYQFSFDTAPQGFENVAVGDKVQVTYTGEVSEVDAFTGTVSSVEKQ